VSTITLPALRAYAVGRSLFAPTTLPRAIAKLGFVQADPIRAPAAAQDLTLRHRVKGYRAGDLERRYPKLAVEEDFFVNYGFVTRELFALMHPREPRVRWSKREQKRAEAVLDFIREKGVVHPREVEAAFSHGTVENWWGGRSNASTQLLESMHRRGMIRVARRKGGVRLYEAREPAAPQDSHEAAMDALVDVVVRKYAPLPEASLRQLITHLGGGAPQYRSERKSMLSRAKERLASAELDGVRWLWPADEDPLADWGSSLDAARMLAPFDPVAWDRRRFELLWGWAYRFEAYTPSAKRVRGYYALPLLYRDVIVGWANVSARDGALSCELGYVSGRAPRERRFREAIDEERARMAEFLGVRA
jgi:uncharacterized protein YcaQ